MQGVFFSSTRASTKASRSFLNGSCFAGYRGELKLRKPFTVNKEIKSQKTVVDERAIVIGSGRVTFFNLSLSFSLFRVGYN